MRGFVGAWDVAEWTGRGLERREPGHDAVEFGPVLNETKKAMMSGFVRSHARTYSRFAPYRWTVPFVVERSHLSSARIAPYVGLKAGTLDDQDASDA